MNRPTIFMVSLYGNHKNHWSEYSIKSWEKYCRKYDIDLFIQDKTELDVFPERPPHFQKFSAFKYEFLDDVAIVDADSLPHPNAPNLFEVHPDPSGLYCWYDPGEKGRPITNTCCHELNPKNSILDEYNILKLIDIEKKIDENSNNWFHVCAGMVLFKKKTFQIFQEQIDDILNFKYLHYCRDESVFDYWISYFFRLNKIKIHRLSDRWFNMPSFTHDNRYNFGPVENAFSIQYTHCKEDLIEHSQYWWGVSIPVDPSEIQK